MREGEGKREGGMRRDMQIVFTESDVHIESDSTDALSFDKTPDHMNGYTIAPSIVTNQYLYIMLYYLQVPKFAREVCEYV